ncbi:Hypothetical Protein FCC1311_000562 [Hondaea fermentalgiana]|uniref:Uncharacterized protein n=1 Tax=Hondaea fermentalgiana TaxID=2315210 RepID=A0A2R5FYK0_9STRA|nr:Hypothetical Protein FCC1311_000562 [Hondaea fermentalgiana]|eukprot:GBG23836.1 Hypothetical Protein FCC1311_000562 [Hondaea fermentalgiana]
MVAWLPSAVDGVREGLYGGETYALSTSHGIVVALSAGNPNVLQLDGKNDQGLSEWSLVDVVDNDMESVDVDFVFAIDRDNFIATDGAVINRYTFNDATASFILESTSTWLDGVCELPVNMHLQEAAVALVCIDGNQTAATRQLLITNGEQDEDAILASKSSSTTIKAEPLWSVANADSTTIGVQTIASSESETFGSALALSTDANMLVIGDSLTDEPTTDDMLLSAYGDLLIFERNDTDSYWVQTASIQAPDDSRCLRTIYQTSSLNNETTSSSFQVQNTCALFGHAVAISPDKKTLAVASRGLRRISGYISIDGEEVLLGQNMTTEARSGAVHIYIRESLQADWMHNRSLFDDVSGLFRHEFNFAESLAFDGNMLVVSAPVLDPSATSNDDSDDVIPSLRVFDASQTWAETSRIKSPLAEASRLGDSMGSAIAITPNGDIVASSSLAEVGVIFEPEDSTDNTLAITDYLIFIGLGVFVLATATIAALITISKRRRDRRRAQDQSVTPRVFIDTSG